MQDFGGFAFCCWVNPNQNSTRIRHNADISHERKSIGAFLGSGSKTQQFRLLPMLEAFENASIHVSQSTNASGGGFTRFQVRRQSRVKASSGFNGFVCYIPLSDSHAVKTCDKASEQSSGGGVGIHD